MHACLQRLHECANWKQPDMMMMGSKSIDLGHAAPIAQKLSRTLTSPNDVAASQLLSEQISDCRCMGARHLSGKNEVLSDWMLDQVSWSCKQENRSLCARSMPQNAEMIGQVLHTSHQRA